MSASWSIVVAVVMSAHQAVKSKYTVSAIVRVAVHIATIAEVSACAGKCHLLLRVKRDNIVGCAVF